MAAPDPRAKSSSFPQKILLIEDDPADACLIGAELMASAPDLQIVHAVSVEAAQACLLDPTIGAVLLDLNLPGVTGLAAVAAVQAGSTGQPILVMTGRAASDVGVEALRLGAQDYLIKEDMQSGALPRAIRHAIERQRLIACMRDSVRASCSSERDLRQLLLQGTDALIVLGRENRVCFANLQAESLLGVRGEQLLSGPCPVSVRPGSEIQQEIERPDGSRVLVGLRCVDVLWRGTPALLISLREIGDRELAREQQIRFEMLTGFLGNMSHELRTPLTAIYQFVSNVRDELLGPMTPEQAEHLGRALHNVDEVLGMVANLLEVTRSHAGKLRIDQRVIDLDAEIAPACDVHAASAREAGLRFSMVRHPRLPLILADAIRVRQILSNLVENAIKFTAAGGEIRVSTDLAGDGRHVILAVEDTGCGVPAEHLERIFERLYQHPDSSHRTRRGLGLGLFITRELVRGLGGDIRVTSQPGEGSRFEISLPVFRWEDLLARLPASRIGGGLQTLVVEMIWRGGDSFEPIPPAALDVVRTILAEEFADAAAVQVPCVSLNGEVRLGAVFRAGADGADRLVRKTSLRLSREAGLTDPALQIRTRLLCLTDAKQTTRPTQLSSWLDTYFVGPYSEPGGKSRAVRRPASNPQPVDAAGPHRRGRRRPAKSPDTPSQSRRV